MEKGFDFYKHNICITHTPSSLSSHNPNLKRSNIQHTVGLFLFKKLLSQDINTNQKTVQLGQ